ncbi:MAG: hypothetical protein RSB86_17395 [Comamonas sp.]|uniref:hypothetical protein n=1 Tax=Comamonas sp. TaxID=34028 RepID=UPI002FCC7DB3
MAMANAPATASPNNQKMARKSQCLRGGGVECLEDCFELDSGEVGMTLHSNGEWHYRKWPVVLPLQGCDRAQWTEVLADKDQAVFF